MRTRAAMAYVLTVVGFAVGGCTDPCDITSETSLVTGDYVYVPSVGSAEEWGPSARSRTPPPAEPSS